MIQCSVTTSATPAAILIHVAGFGAFRAQRVVVNGHDIGAMSVAGSHHLAVYDGTEWLHCPPCNKAIRPGAPIAKTLGYPLCPPCDDTWRQHCLTLYDRLPRTDTEFFCRGCDRIVQRGDLCSPDADGRKRWRCKPCRKGEVARAGQRRALNARAGSA